MLARRVLAPAVFCVVVALAACSKQTAQTTTAPPSPAAVTGNAASGTSAAPAAEASAPATPTPTPTPIPNLLDPANGTVVRSFPAAFTQPDQIPDSGFSVDPTATGPWVIVFELPGVTTLTSLSGRFDATTNDGKGSTATFALSTTSATAGFSDVGRLSSAATGAVQTLALNNQRARWIRATVTRRGRVTPLNAVGAYGTIAPMPAASAIAGTYVQYSTPYGAGAFASAPTDPSPWYVQVVTLGQTGINGAKCYDGRLSDAYPGTFDGRTWRWQRSDGPGTFIANDEGTLLISSDGSYWGRSPQRPKFCFPQMLGSGSSNILVLESPGWFDLYPIDPSTLADVPGVRFTRIGAALFDPAMLAGASTVILNGLCNADDLLAQQQDDAIAQWVQNGHKLMIYDADMCGKGVHYALLPYQFKSDNPGAQGAKGDRLIQVEDDSLGTSDKSDKAHYFDPIVWATNGNQLGDANTVTTQDPHWCGHFFGTNVNHVNGFMQMYAQYGSGLIIYDGFDHDDGTVPSYQRMRQLEIAQPVPGDLGCTEKVALAFLIEPNRDGSFVPGKPVTKTFAMELLANQGWKGHITMSTSGDFRAAVTPSAFDIDGTTQPLTIAVSIPGNAKPGTYAIIVNGDGGNGQTAQATIQLHAAVPLVKQIKSQRRIRIYGIHFDVDKATIKPQSEPVIAQIAQVMQQNPSWRFRVEGHTDSDGGLQHNQVLSQHRAESVVNDLIKRYHIAKSRLVPVGFGYSRPVAPNTTAAGKSLNRRVELYLLSGN
jgi:outer membrane protein OmpA-like peptidoglycan-associated protein